MKKRFNIIPLFLIFFISGVFAQPGSLDLSFNPGTGANSTINTTSLQSDGKIIIGGYFTSFNGTARKSIARLNADGSLDVSFDPGTGANSDVNTVTVQDDEKIIIAGNFTSYNGTPRNRIARLNSDGSLDATFDPGTGADDIIMTAILQDDEKIIIGGLFTSYNGSSRISIARLNSDGSLDTSFYPGTGANDRVFTATLQNDGKIIIGGDFSSYNGTPRKNIARINSDGSLDASFNPGAGADNPVWATILQNNGKIIIGGLFRSFNGISRSTIARLNSDGSLDTSFNPGTGATQAVFTLTLQSNEKIIIGGEFFQYNGTPINNIARLNSDGSLDTSFNPGTGAQNIVRTSTLQKDGKIIIGGNFTSYDGTSRNRVARIAGDLISSSGRKVIARNISVYPNPFSSQTVLQTDYTLKNANITVKNSIGQTVKELKNINGNTVILPRANLPAGLYFIRLSENKNVIAVKKVIITD